MAPLDDPAPAYVAGARRRRADARGGRIVCIQIAIARSALRARERHERAASTDS